MDLTIAKQLISYDPITGIFIRKSSGKVIGSNTAQGYLAFHLLGKTLLAHRVVFFLETGEFPKGQVDHIDGNKHNNKRDNLRIVTSQQNKFNRKPNQNRIGLQKNVYWMPKLNRYRVKMKINGQTKHFGYFNDHQEAIAKAIEVQEKYHGEYAPKT